MVCHKSHEVCPFPDSGNAPLGSTDRHTQGIGHSIPGPDRNDYSCNSSIVRPIPGLCSSPSSGHGVAGILPCFSPPLHVSSSSSVDSPERSLQHEGRSHLKADPPVISSDPVSSGILVTPGSSVPRRSSSTPSSYSRPNDRRVHLWMGSGLRSSDCKRVWSSKSVFSPYKLLELETIFPCLEEIPEVAVWHTRSGSDGQHFGDALFEQGRRDQVQVLGLEGQGDYSLVSEHEDHIVSSTYLGTGKCGGSPLSVSNRESSPIGAFHRMVSQPQGNQPVHFDIWGLPPAQSGCFSVAAYRLNHFWDFWSYLTSLRFLLAHFWGFLRWEV